MPEKYLKAMVHGFLMGLGTIELLNCKTRTRKFVLGTAVGWHAHACFYHLILEKSKHEKDQTDTRVRSSRGLKERP